MRRCLAWVRDVGNALYWRCVGVRERVGVRARSSNSSSDDADDEGREEDEAEDETELETEPGASQSPNSMQSACH